MSLRDFIAKRIQTQGPLLFADYMDLALYHPVLGYYARVDRRSGRAGDFYTSVDVGTQFGELLAQQFSEMWTLATSPDGAYSRDFSIVEVGAGSGRLARSVLDHAATAFPAFYEASRFTLIERSPAGRAAHTDTIGEHAPRLAASSVELPSRIHGVIFANELLDALPSHPIVMTETGLREIYVDTDGNRFIERLGDPSATVQAHVERFGIRLAPGWRAEVNPTAVRWVQDAARRLEHGFLMLIDYGHHASELYSLAHATGTLTCYRRHQVAGGDENFTTPPWLKEPGQSDITAHVDLTAVQTTAEQEGLQTIGILDQTYFLLALALAEETAHASEDGIDALKRRLALKTLLVPGGIGSTHKVLIFGRGIGTPRLQGCSFSVRTT